MVFATIINIGVKAINSCLWFLSVFGGFVTTCIQIRLMTNQEDEEEGETTEPYDTLIDD